MFIVDFIIKLIQKKKKKVYLNDEQKMAISKFAELGYASQASAFMKELDKTTNGRTDRAFDDTSIIRWAKSDNYKDYYEDQKRKFRYNKKEKKGSPKYPEIELATLEEMKLRRGQGIIIK